MKRYLILVMILLPLICLSLTRQVALDGSQAYTSIQTAINDAVSGDMVLVHPGRYLENINMSDKSNIVLASLEYSTADTTYISSTIIDGSNGNTSTILCYENTVNCTISGFSITGGKGYAFLSGASLLQVSGGGILIYRNNSLTIRNMDIFGNHATTGGGISIGSPNTVHMSGVNIHENYARYLGGGLALGSDPYLGAPDIVFSQIGRCSIYNNFAQWGMDIHWHYIHGGTLSVYLKKFTVPQWEKYYASYYDSTYPPSPYTVFDIQEAYLQPIDADLYVSPNGDDSNDGLSAASALKTPSRAMQRIASNPDNPRTAHLLAGVHHNLFGGEYIPISIKDYCTLRGVSEAETRLYGEYMVEGTGVVSMGIESYGNALKDLSITSSHASAIFSWGIHDYLMENITIENSTVDRWILNIGFRTSTMTLRNVTMRNNLAYFAQNGMDLMGSIILLDSILLINNRTESLSPWWYNRGGGCFDAYVSDALTIRNSKFINNTHYSEDGWANIRISGWTDEPAAVVDIDNCLFASNVTYGGARDINPGRLLSLSITNCTFANNIGTYPDFLYLLSIGSSRIVNSLFSNNSASYEIRAADDTIVENCLFSRTNNIYRTYNGMPLNWGSHNIIGSDPLFNGTDPALPDSYSLFSDVINGYSPAIDAGTMDIGILPLGYTIPQYDAFGNNRLYGNGIDIGCYESPGYTGIEEFVNPALGQLSISNYPNPFNPSTTISYTVPKAGDVRLCIYNTKGQLVKNLVNESRASGKHSVIWNGMDNNGKSVSSGLYIYRIFADNRVVTGKMILTK